LTSTSAYIFAQKVLIFCCSNFLPANEIRLSKCSTMQVTLPDDIMLHYDFILSLYSNKSN
ncbi:hypothetical protein QN372_20735, partial [Undibacterium sp. RTI2.1]|uniref:hypothetical protein n=1 Tax=Undibacterium sp. RTI2.1 TaxID=3048637 RepID=UPI002B22AEEC